MDSEYSKIRERSRDDIKHNRELSRQIEQDQLRYGLGEIKAKISEQDEITIKDMAGLATRIKRRRHADEKDLHRLSNGFLQSSENIQAFVEVRDAINVITKMFIGTDANLQIMACECLCNISLGGEFCCQKVALSCGTYLLTYLNHTNHRLAKTCLWVLANLSASGEETLKILLSQKMIQTVLTFLETSFDEDISSECCITIKSIIENGTHLISSEEKEQMLQSCINCKTLFNDIKIQLTYKILMSLEFKLSNLVLLSLCLEFIVSNFIITSNNTINNADDLLKIIFLIRTLGNFIAFYDEGKLFFIEYLIKANLSLCDILNKLFYCNQKIFFKELIWLVGNLNNSTLEIVQNYLRDDKLIENLHVLEENVI